MGTEPSIDAVTALDRRRDTTKLAGRSQQFEYVLEFGVVERVADRFSLELHDGVAEGSGGVAARVGDPAVEGDLEHRVRQTPHEVGPRNLIRALGVPLVELPLDLVSRRAQGRELRRCEVAGVRGDAQNRCHIGQTERHRCQAGRARAAQQIADRS
jgi:hypothetical protein